MADKYIICYDYDKIITVNSIEEIKKEIENMCEHEGYNNTNDIPYFYIYELNPNINITTEVELKVDIKVEPNRTKEKKK